VALALERVAVAGKFQEAKHRPYPTAAGHPDAKEFRIPGSALEPLHVLRSTVPKCFESRGVSKTPLRVGSKNGGTG
jgi:hypothetical protein